MAFFLSLLTSIFDFGPFLFWPIIKGFSCYCFVFRLSKIFFGMQPEDLCLVRCLVKSLMMLSLFLQKLEEQFAMQLEEQEVCSPSHALPSDLADFAHHMGSTRSSISSVSEG